MTESSDQPQNGSRSLALLGDATDIRTWSNIPYFLFKNAKPSGFLTHALNLADPNYSKRRLLWGLRNVARLHWPPRGYGFSDACARRAWEMVPEELKHGEFLSHAQTFPSLDAMRRGQASFSYFIDATLRTNAVDLKDSSGMSPRLVQGFWDRERELYRGARFVVAMSRRTARSLVNDYEINPQKVFVVRAGANIDDDAVADFLSRTSRPAWREGAPFTNENPAVLGFIGMHPIRKNLPLLVEVAQILQSRGRPVKVRVIGACPEELMRHPLVDFVGRIDKRAQTQRFIEMVSTFAIGTLLSTGEPLGISTLECLRLGVPVLGRNTGGIPDCIPPVAGILTAADADAQQIADLLEPRLFDPGAYALMCKAALAESDNTTWRVTVENLRRVWRGEWPSFKNDDA
jgi:glycosyltransferase involved in cell wall biosynthesis